MAARVPSACVLAMLAAVLVACLVGGASAKSQGEDGKRVLVLGSGGLVGRTLVQWLEERDYQVVHVRNRRHIDLRVPGALDVFNNTKYSSPALFAFFLCLSYFFSCALFSFSKLWLAPNTELASTK